jgi:hypothetical protein
MALTGLHDDFGGYTYLHERDVFLQLRENSGLAGGDQTQLRPHWDGGTSIAFGYGFDLLVRVSPDARLTDQQAVAEITGYFNVLNSRPGVVGKYTLTQNDMRLLRQARARRDAGTANQAYLQNIADQLSFAFVSEPDAAALLQTIADRYERALNQALGDPPDNPNQLLQSKERIAIISLLFTMATPTAAAIRATIPATLNAITNDNRAEAWYEIRYGSNRNGIHASRRYGEAEYFGLYDAGNRTEAEAKEIMRMYTSHQILETDATRTMTAYEDRFPLPAGYHDIDTSVADAKNYLIDHFTPLSWFVMVKR